MNDDAIDDGCVGIRYNRIEAVTEVRVIAKDGKSEKLRFNREGAKQLRGDVGVDRPADGVGSTDSNDAEHAGIVGGLVGDMVVAGKDGVELGIYGRDVDAQGGIDVIDLVGWAAGEVDVLHAGDDLSREVIVLSWDGLLEQEGDLGTGELKFGDGGTCDDRGGSSGAWIRVWRDGSSGGFVERSRACSASNDFGDGLC